MSPPERQTRLGLFPDALRRLADKGRTAAAVIATFYWQRVL